MPRRTTRQEKHQPYIGSDNSCSTKVRYPTRLQAERAATETMLLSHDPELTLRTYQCLACKGWHLTRTLYS